MFRFLLVSFLFLASNVWAQDRTISGNVTSDDDGSVSMYVRVFNIFFKKVCILDILYFLNNC